MRRWTCVWPPLWSACAVSERPPRSGACSPRVRVLVAPNAFKGSLSCVDAARAMARGVRAVFKSARVTSIPIADGGDGLIDALRVAMGGKIVSSFAHGPLGERRRASYLW
ncbi:MAG: hypothetical protein COV48_13345, partial [Elusimicrobia bacterium CG11_big_fil_rev_8_21_14_0_20_64_6]